MVLCYVLHGASAMTRLAPTPNWDDSSTSRARPVQANLKPPVTSLPDATRFRKGSCHRPGHKRTCSDGWSANPTRTVTACIGRKEMVLPLPARADSDRGGP